VFTTPGFTPYFSILKLKSNFKPNLKMNNIDIDIEMLISLVELRHVLWDITSESYKNKQQKINLVTSGIGTFKV